jgi:hypothetical protein
LIFEQVNTLKKLSSILFLMVIAVSVFSQADTAKLDIRYNQKPFNQVIRDLHRSTGLSFAMESRILPDHKITIEKDNIPLSGVLDYILQDTGYGYRVMNNTVVIYKLPVIIPAFDGVYAGKIADAVSGEPLPFASVRVEGTMNATLADGNGRFYLDNLTSDTLNLVVQYIGYQSMVFKPGLIKRDELLILLKADPERLPVAEIVSRDQGIGQYEALTSAYSFNPSLSVEIPGSGLRDVLRPLTLIPGVNAGTESFSGFEVRGAASDQARIYFDGIPIYHSHHFFGYLSAFNAEAVQNVRTSRGAFSSAMGDANSALIQISGKEGSRYHTKTSAGFDLLSADLNVSVPFPDKSGAFTLNARRSYTDYWQSPAYKSMYNTLFTRSASRGAVDLADAFNQSSRPDFRFYDLNARLTWDLNKSNHLKFSFFNSNDKLNAAYTLEIPESLEQVKLRDESDWGNTGASLHLDHAWSERSVTTAMISHSVYRSFSSQQDVTRDLIFNSVDSVNSMESAELNDFNAKLEHRLSETNHKILLGLWYYSRSTSNEKVRPADLDTTLFSSRGNGFALFIEDRFPIGENVEMMGGIRANYFDLAQDFRMEPRLSITWRPLEFIGVKLATGRHSQTIRRVREQDLYLNAADNWRMADGEQIPVLNSRHILVGIFGETKSLQWQLEGYYRRSDGEILDAITVNYSLGENGSDEFYKAISEAYGLDLSVGHTYKDWSNWFNLSLSQTVMQSDELAFGNWFNAPTDQPFAFKWFSQYKLKNWSFNLNLILASGRRHTSVLGTFETQMLNGTELEFIQYAIPYSSTLSDYKRMDFSVNRTFRWQKARCLAGFSLYNLTGFNNVADRVYSLDESKNVQMRDIPLLMITPGLNFRITWE